MTDAYLAFEVRAALAYFVKPPTSDPTEQERELTSQMKELL